MSVRSVLICVIVILTYASLLLCFAGCGNPPVTFTDTVLEQVVRQAINKADGDILLSDVKKITILDASNKNISNLWGLQYCTALIKLNLNNNDIADITPLSSLVKLEELNLSQNDVVDISTLRCLTNLTWLSLGRNSVSDVSSLAELTKITTLILSVNQISDISPLTSLVKLQTLQLHMNQISDLSVLADLTSLRDIGLMGNSITSIQPLVHNEGLGAGTTIDLCGNPLDTDSITIYVPQLQAKGAICLFS